MTTMNIYDMVDTWNAGATTFTAIRMNVTDTASAAGSLLMDLQVGGTSRFSVSKTGIITTNANVNIGANSITANGFRTTGSFGNLALLTDSSPVVAWGASQDTQLTRDAADTLAQRRGTSAQAHRWYRSFTDASNYSRVYLGWSSSTAILATEGAGTGSRGNIAFGTAALATSATVGYVMIPSSAGAPTGVPADIPTGQVALHYDTSNNKIYVYNGGWISTAALT
jgi:hypothetical protein